MTALPRGLAQLRSRRKRRGPQREASPLTYAVLLATVLFSVFPLYWMLVVATRGNEVIAMRPPPMTPGGNLVANIERLLSNADANFLTGLTNSLISSTTVAVSQMFLCSLAGFAFAKLRFRGRNVLLVTVVLTMMIPVQLGLIPLYILMAEIGWVGELPAVIVPFLVTGFGVFMMRQYSLQAIPDELIEAARLDGCSTLRIYWSVVLPALRPAMAALGLLMFMQNWNDFIWPLAVMNPGNPTVQYSINQLANAYYNDYSLMFSGALLATLPLLIVFGIFGRQIIGGIMEGAVKQ